MSRGQVLLMAQHSVNGPVIKKNKKKLFFPSVINIKGLKPVMNSKIDSSG